MRMDQNLFRLLQQFSRQFVATKPPDLEALGLAYVNRAYELGRDTERADVGRDRGDTRYQWQSGATDSGSESGLDV